MSPLTGFNFGYLFLTTTAKYQSSFHGLLLHLLIQQLPGPVAARPERRPLRREEWHLGCQEPGDAATVRVPLLAWHFFCIPITPTRSAPKGKVGHLVCQLRLFFGVQEGLA